MTFDHDLSRRDFLAASALGALGLTSRRAAQPGGEMLYVGTYTEGKREDGVFLLRMDTRTGELRQVGAMQVGPEPSFLALHPSGRVLYVVNETMEREGRKTGGVSAFAIAADTGGLTRLSDHPSEGGAPCYISVDTGGRAALVANYMGGNVAMFPIEAGGALGPAAAVVQHHGSGPNAARQEAPHAHCIVADPSNRYAFAVDLGIDRVIAYRLDVLGARLEEVPGGGATMRPGAGPRHLVFHQRAPLAFVANELDSTVSSLRFDAATGVLTPLVTVSTLTAGWKGENYPADIHVSPSGSTLYVSNRGNNSIAVFSINESTGGLTQTQVIPTEGNWPRNFSIDPTGRWLLVANQRSGSIIVFARDPESGRLTKTSMRIDVPSPVCLRFKAHAGVNT
jgi:6-phosphogluconolactonase